MEINPQCNVTGSIGLDKYQCSINWEAGSFLMDEPVSFGGKDTGPDPYSTLLAALAGCTLSTLRMYIDRKEWDIPAIDVNLDLFIDKTTNFTSIFKRTIHFPTSISKEQKERLLVIANKCPVSKILENKIIINTDIKNGN